MPRNVPAADPLVLPEEKVAAKRFPQHRTSKNRVRERAAVRGRTEPDSTAERGVTMRVMTANTAGMIEYTVPGMRRERQRTPPGRQAATQRASGALPCAEGFSR